MVDVHKINIVKKKKICHTRIYSVFIPRSLSIITLPVIFLCICMYRMETKFPSLIGVYIQGFPCGSAGKESACNAGDLGSIPRLGRSPGEGKRLPTPVLWPGEFHESPWSCKELDMTEQLSLHWYII